MRLFGVKKGRAAPSTENGHRQAESGSRKIKPADADAGASSGSLPDVSDPALQRYIEEQVRQRTEAQQKILHASRANTHGAGGGGGRSTNDNAGAMWLYMWIIQMLMTFWGVVLRKNITAPQQPQLMQGNGRRVRIAEEENLTQQYSPRGGHAVEED